MALIVTGKKFIREVESSGAVGVYIPLEGGFEGRYKRRIRNHHNHRAGPVEFGGAPSYILAATEDAEDVEPETLQPVVIAEMETKIPSITVGEAVMQLELAGQRMLVFRNEGHGGVNVVYRREDGNIGWIDPPAVNAG